MSEFTQVATAAHHPHGVIGWLGTVDKKPAIITVDRDSADLHVFKSGWFGGGQWEKVKEFDSFAAAKEALGVD